MPGRGSYGPGGKWIYERAAHIRSRNPDMEEGTSFAIATQQAHKLGKSNKGHRTKAGVKKAKAKYSKPRKEYRKTATGPEPKVGQQKLAMLHGFFDELEKIGAGVTRMEKGSQGASELGIPGGGSAASLGIPGGGPPTSAAGAGAGPSPSPSAAGLGIPSGGDPMGGAGGAGTPATAGGAPSGPATPPSPPPAPPPPPPAGGAGTATGPAGTPSGVSRPPGPSPGSLLSPERTKGPGTGRLSAADSAEVAKPSASEFGG